MNDHKSRYKANYTLTILKIFIITFKLYIYWIKKIGPRMENIPMEKLLEHALSKPSNTHSKMIRISIDFLAMIVTIGVLKVKSFSRHGTIPFF